MSKLYLIRRNLESYLGPMSINELKDAYKRMEFGLQDEVSKHCVRWVAFDDVEKIKRYYPELSGLVKEDMLRGWGVSQHSAEKILKNQTTEKKTTLKRLSLILLIIILGLGGGIGFYFIKESKLSGRFFESNDQVYLKQASELLAKGDQEGFEEFMDQLLPAMIPRMNRSRKVYNDWIVHLRHLAFSRTGYIPGLKPKLLRGMGQFAAPLDCSLKTWKNRWVASKEQWPEFIQGQTIPNQPWVKMILWDPHWIRRRNQVEGWHYPSNYYEACLIMGIKALEQYSQENQGEDIKLTTKAYQNRLQWILSIIRGQKPVGSAEMPPSLQALSCIEAAERLEELQKCYDPKNITAVWNQVMAARLSWNELRILLETNPIIDDALVTRLNTVYAALKADDPITKFNYQPELKFLRTIMLSRGRMEETLTRMKYEFPEVNFRF